MRAFIVVLALFSVILQGCVTDSREAQSQALDAEFEATIPKVKAWHDDCHSHGVADACLNGARFALKFGANNENFRQEAMKDLIKACELGSEIGCFEKERLKARIIRSDSYAEEEKRDRSQRSYESDRAATQEIIQGMKRMNQPAPEAPAPVFFPKKTHCASRYNQVTRDYETVCEER